MALINEHILLAATDPIVELYELNCTAIGGSTYYFTPMVDASLTEVKFAGKSWQPIPIMTEGFVYSSTDAPAKPTITISNINKQLLGAVISLGDLVGGKVTRYRTFQRFLTNGSSPDSTAYLPKDVFYIEKKVVHNRINIQWQLTGELDKSGLKLPKRLFLRRDFPGLAQTRFRN